MTEMAMCFIQVVPSSYMVPSCHSVRCCFFPSSLSLLFLLSFFPFYFGLQSPIWRRIGSLFYSSFSRSSLACRLMQAKRRALRCTGTSSQRLSPTISHTKGRTPVLKRCCCLCPFFCFDAKLSAKPRILLSTKKNANLLFVAAPATQRGKNLDPARITDSWTAEEGGY